MRHEVRGVLVGVVVLVVGLGVPTGAAEPADVGPLDSAAIIVRTYTEPSLAGEIGRARQVAGVILDRAGVQIEWVECGPAAAAAFPARCSQPVRPDELVIRVLSAGPVGGRSGVGTLGFAFVALDTGGSWLATVYADRVRAMARAAGAGVAELLGRAMAHEVGHLLLGTNQHASQGLMRASWSSADLRRNVASQWLFGEREGEAMRKEIVDRLRWSARPPVGSPSIASLSVTGALTPE